MEPIIGGEIEVADLVKDSNAQHFVADVIETSKKTPVIVDFWAPWCGPCKELGPQIERAVTARAGKIKLVKINVDENQEIAAQFQIQSIPAVFAFKEGRPVDGFVGALPESQIQAFVDRVAGETGPSPIDSNIEQAGAMMEAGEFEQASAVYEQILAHDPTNPAAIGGTIRCQIAVGDLTNARTRLDAVDDALLQNASIAGAKAALELAEEPLTAGNVEDLTALRNKLDKAADDHQTRYDLACALWANAQRESAIDELLEIIQHDRTWNNEAARKQLIKYFDAMGPTDPLMIAARGRLSSLLFA